MTFCPYGEEVNVTDPRLDANARRVVKSGRYTAVEDGQGGLFLRLTSDRPEVTYPARNFFRQSPLIPTIAKSRSET